MNGTLAIPVRSQARIPPQAGGVPLPRAIVLRWSPDLAAPLDRKVSRLAAPLLIAIIAHAALAVIFAAVPLHKAITPGKFAPASVRFNFVGLAEPGGHPAAGGSGRASDAPPARTVAALLPTVPAATMPPPRSPVTVIGVFDPLAPTTDAHLNIQIGTAPPPSGGGPGFGYGSGAGIGDGTAAGMAGSGGRGPGGYGGWPSGRHNPKPPYPELARRRGWEGTTILLIEIRTDGTVGRVEVRQSSGHRILDDASVETVRTWEFNPARRDDAPVTTWVEVPIRYRLSEG